MNKDRYPFIVYAIRMYEEGWTKSQIKKEYHVDSATFNYWYARYKEVGDLSVLQNEKQCQVSEDDKIKIVKEVQENRLSLQQASIQYSVSTYTVKRWLKAYKQYGEAGLRRKNKAGTMAKKKTYTPEQLDELAMLRRRNEYLEAENALLKKVKALVEEREARLRATGRKPSKD